jgi:hypothetical protein
MTTTGCIAMKALLLSNSRPRYALYARYARYALYAC